MGSMIPVVLLLAAAPAPFDVLELWRGADISVDWGKDADLQAEEVRTAMARLASVRTKSAVVAEIRSAARALSRPVIVAAGRPAGSLLRFDALGGVTEVAVELKWPGEQPVPRLLIIVPAKQVESLRRELEKVLGERAPVVSRARRSAEWVLQTPLRFDSPGQLEQTAQLLAAFGSGTFAVDDPLSAVTLAKGKATITPLQHTAATPEDARTFARLISTPPPAVVVTTAALGLEDSAPFGLPLWLPEEFWNTVESRAWDSDTSLSKIVQACLDAPADGGVRTPRRWTGPMLNQTLFLNGRQLRALERVGQERRLTASEQIGACAGSR